MQSPARLEGNAATQAKPASVRNPTLHAALEAFASAATAALAAETAAGAEVPFEVAESSGRAGRASLYCYRPLTGTFINERLGLLAALETYASAARALSTLDTLELYLEQRAIRPLPREPRERADAALQAFLEQLFAERSQFRFDRSRFATAYEELERVVYEGRSATTVITPLLGVALEPGAGEVPLGDGLSLVPGEQLEGAPPEAVWGTPGLDVAEEPNVLAVLTVAHDRAQRPPVSLARSRFRRVLAALRLFERGGYALGPLAWMRSDEGVWRPVALGGSGRPGLVTLIPATQEDELRAFYNLMARRAPRGRKDDADPSTPAGGELAWALARFEMGCERVAPFEALTDYLLALRALLEPEGAHSGRLAQRLAVLCAAPEDRLGLAERVAHAISLERAVIGGLAPAQTGVDALVTELCEHLRALLRDVICGHLEPDLRAVADGLLVETVPAQA